MYFGCMVPQILQRRTLLSALCCVLVLVSGCAAISGESAHAELGAITVENSDQRTHTINILLERDAKPVYGKTITLNATSPPENESDYGGIDSVLLNDSTWSSKSGNWTVYTRIDSATSWQRHTLPSDGGDNCYSVRLKIESDSSVTSFTPTCASWPSASGGNSSAAVAPMGSVQIS